MVEQLKDKNPSQWYTQLKRMSSYDQGRSDQITVDEIDHLSDRDQAEAIADHFASVSQEYEHLQVEDIQIPEIPPGSVPEFTRSDVHKELSKLKV